MEQVLNFSSSILGTAQIASSYGITNKRGDQTLKKAVEILQRSISLGLKKFDTSIDYPNSHKTLEMLPEKEISKCTIIDKANSRSLKKILEDNYCSYWPWMNKFSSLGGSSWLMLHNGASYKDIETRKDLFKCKEKGIVKKIGISIYDVSELEQCLDIGGLDIIQIPLSLADRRFADKKIRKKIKLAQVEVHVRSVFLQGIIINKPKINFYKQKEYIDRFNNFIRVEKDLKKRLSIAMASVLGDIDCLLVMGVDSIEQINFLESAFKNITNIKSDTIKNAQNIWAKLPKEIIDPRLWKK